MTTPDSPKPEGLPRERRLRRRADFVRVQGAPRVKLRCSGFLLLISQRSEPGVTRMGAVASRRIGGSVQRSRAKRLLKELFRKHKSCFGDALDVVLVAQAGVHLKHLSDLESELSRVEPELRRRLRQLASSHARSHGALDREGPKA